MPTLHLRLTPNANNGITKCLLSNPLKAQKFRLHSIVVNKQSNGYNHGHIYLRIPFATASQVHTTDKKGYLLIPTAKSTSGMEIHNFSDGLPIEADNIPQSFECQLLQADMTPFTSNTNLLSVDLYYGYESHSLF